MQAFTIPTMAAKMSLRWANDNFLYGNSKMMLSLDGKAINSELNDTSKQYIYSTGIAENTVINDDSWSWIKEGGKSIGYMNVNDNGIVYIDTGTIGGGYAESIHLKGENTMLNVRIMGVGTSATVDDLKGIGTVQFRPFPTAMGRSASVDFTTLKVGNLSGALNFVMRTDLVGDGNGNNSGDLLLVTGTASGEHTLTVLNDGSANADGTDVLTVIKTQGTDSQFTLNQVVELGGYEHYLRRNGTNWEHIHRLGIDQYILRGLFT